MFDLNRSVAARRAWLPYCVPGSVGRTVPPRLALEKPDLWEGWACRQKIMGILYRNSCDKEWFAALPDDLRNRMEHYYLDSHFQQSVTDRALGPLAAAFKAKGIAFILLKGPALSRPFYPDPAVRPLHDLDILVKEADRKGAGEALASLPYRMDRTEEEYLRGKNMCERLFVPESPALPNIEIHWDIVNSAGLRANLRYDEKSAFDRRSWLSVDGPAVATLKENDLLVYACVHAALQHQMSRLIWLVDILQILKKHPEMLADEGRSLGASAFDSPGARMAVYACLRFVGRLFSPELRKGPAPMVPPGWVPRMLLRALPAGSLLFPESRIMIFRKQLFREAFKAYVQ